MHPKNLCIEDFMYSLPDGRIAKYPIKNRDEARLLVYNQGPIIHSSFDKIESFLKPGSTLIFNNTKVIPARIHFQKTTGGAIEIFCLEPVSQSHSNGSATWKCLVGGASKWKAGITLTKKLDYANAELILNASLQNKLEDYFIINFTWNRQELDFIAVLEKLGYLPIPPYLNRPTEKIDVERYQTVYSLYDGSVAAPTAGLHFTPTILDQLRSNNIATKYVTLHVGAGTFAPVKSTKIEGHSMHGEYATVDMETLEYLITCLEKNDIIAVGTTSMRTLESLYWLGLQRIKNSNVFDLSYEFVVSQWEPYETQELLSTKECLWSLVSHLRSANKTIIDFKTHIIIAPGYVPKVVNALITNFHQPKSTLLLLIAACIGANWKTVYEHALKNDYRFLSYGDSSLLRW